MATLVNQFSWSKSQDEMFRECRRRYYYARYGAWQGWPGGSGGPQAQALYRLKQLKTGRMWLGEAVHSTIEQGLKAMRASQGFALEQTTETLSNRMRKDFRDSKAGRFQDNPKGFCRLFEHEYGVTVSDAKWVELHETAKGCLKNFFESQIYQKLTTLKADQWRAIENLEEFPFEGTKVYVKLDLAITADDKLLIVDWKTGRAEDIDFGVQVGTYFLFAMSKWKCPPEDIQALQVELADLKEIPHPGLAAKVGWTVHYIRNSITAMRAVLRDKDKNLAVEEDFPKVNSHRSCSWCNYKRICKPPVLAE